MLYSIYDVICYCLYCVALRPYRKLLRLRSLWRINSGSSRSPVSESYCTEYEAVPIPNFQAPSTAIKVSTNTNTTADTTVQYNTWLLVKLQYSCKYPNITIANNITVANQSMYWSAIF